MAIYVVGAGGIGCTIGYTLLWSRVPVIFVECNSEKVDWGNRFGVSVDKYRPRPAVFHHFDDWKPAADDVVFLCVKCYDNPDILEKLPDTVELIPIQNGYDSALDARNHLCEGIASFVAHCQPNRPIVRGTRSGDFYFGSRHGDSTALRYLKSLPIDIYTPIFVNDIRPIKATKLMYNAAISPLAAAAGIDNGELLSDPVARNLFFDLLKENYSILTAANVPLGKVGPFHPHTVMKILRTPWLARLMSKYFVRSLRGTYCSMAGDIEKGRTELDNYTGHLLRLAGVSIPAPLNRAVYDVVSQLRSPDRAILKKIR